MVEEHQSAQQEAPSPDDQPIQQPAPDIQSHKAMAIIGYIVPFLFFVPLLSEAKNNPYARFHAHQQLNLLLLWVLGHVAASVLSVILIGLLLYPLVMVTGIVLMIIGISTAARGEMKPLPLIGKFQLLQ